MRIVLTLVVVVLAVAGFAAVYAGRDGDTTLQRLELQAETRTCRDALETGVGPRVTDYCNDIIERHDAMVKAYKEEQLQQLIERAQED